MKKYLIELLAVVIMFIGYMCIEYYMKQHLSIVSCSIGMVGLIILSPVVTAWKSFLKNFLNND
jgi:hypothetical protein